MIIKSIKLRWTGHFVRKGEGRSDFKTLKYRSIGKRTLGKLRSRCDENVITDLKEIVVDMTNWIDSIQDRDFSKALMNLRVS